MNVYMNKWRLLGNLIDIFNASREVALCNVYEKENRAPWLLPPPPFLLSRDEKSFLSQHTLDLPLTVRLLAFSCFQKAHTYV